MIIQNNKYHEINDKQDARERENAEKQARIAAAEETAKKLFCARREIFPAVNNFFTPEELNAYFASKVFIACILESSVLDTLADKIAAKFAASSLATAVAMQANKDALAAATKRAEEARARAEELARNAARNASAKTL